MLKASHTDMTYKQTEPLSSAWQCLMSRKIWAEHPVRNWWEVHRTLWLTKPREGVDAVYGGSLGGAIYPEGQDRLRTAHGWYTCMLPRGQASCTGSSESFA